MKLYWAERTRAARTMWLLEEIGAAYERMRIDLYDDASRSDPGFRAASPMGKVPALIDGETALCDSAAIGLYLADRYPDAGLAPVMDDPLRGPYLYWMVFTPGVLEPAFMEKMSGAEPNKHSHGWGDFESMVATLEGTLARGPWLLGERFSAADTLVGSSLHFLSQLNVLPESEALKAYVERCVDRPAYQRTLAADGESTG